MVGASISEEGNGSSSTLPRKRQRSSSDGAKRVGTTEEDKRRSATMLGLDVLDCPICYEPLAIPIFQCDNGHLACSSCCPKLSNKCPACALPVGHSRCRAMETVLDSIFIPCRNTTFGCTKKFTYGKESAHEKECNYTPCTCPVQDCDYTCSFKYISNHFCDHEDLCLLNWFNFGNSFSIRMNITDKIKISTEASSRLLFPIQCFTEPCGVYVTVSCISPPAPKVSQFSFHLSYTTSDGHTVVYKSPAVKRVLKVSYETPQDNFLLIPRNLLRGDSFELKLCIIEPNQV